MLESDQSQKIILEREMEEAEIKKKYDELFQSLEMETLQKKKDLQLLQQKVCKQQILAEAFQTRQPSAGVPSWSQRGTRGLHITALCVFRHITALSFLGKYSKGGPCCVKFIKYIKKYKQRTVQKGEKTRLKFFSKATEHQKRNYLYNSIKALKWGCFWFHPMITFQKLHAFLFYIMTWAQNCCLSAIAQRPHKLVGYH
jgi:hypothetical protein